MCVSNTIYVCQGSNKHGMNILIHRHQKHASNIKTWKACKQYMGVKDCYQSLEGNLLVSKTWWSSPPSLPLKVMHPIDFL